MIVGPGNQSNVENVAAGSMIHALFENASQELVHSRHAVCGRVTGEHGFLSRTAKYTTSAFFENRHRHEIETAAKCSLSLTVHSFKVYNVDGPFSTLNRC